ncbi:photosystem II reaction center protein PsbN [Pseudomonas putida]|nr:photosystem II reaction center protein PsbN [Pseudomonas putida]
MLIIKTTPLSTISISNLLINFTKYTLYITFKQPSQQLKNPFKKHEN